VSALKPLANLRVLASPSERYPLNRKCAHPECDRETADPHHAFPRSQIAGDSWFVIIANEETGKYDSEPIPHVTGLCRIHHSDVEIHQAWIKLEDGIFNWYDREGITESSWTLAGPLNPQPGSVEGKPKRRKKPKQPARKKAVYSIRVPKDMEEDGYEVLETLIDANRERLSKEFSWTESVPDYYVLSAVLAEGLQ